MGFEIIYEDKYGDLQKEIVDKDIEDLVQELYKLNGDGYKIICIFRW